MGLVTVLINATTHQCLRSIRIDDVRWPLNDLMIFGQFLGLFSLERYALLFTLHIKDLLYRYREMSLQA